MAKVLKLSTLAFTRTHCAKTDGHFHLKAPEKDCHFLIGTRCSVYSGRPEQCRTWPFWPENLNSKTWNAEIVPFCKGVGKGRLYSTAEIEVLAKRDPIR